MKADVILDDIFSRRTRGIKPGLERIRAVASALGAPQDSYRIIHIAGTNGKGSTASMVASILQQSGATVGLYTSPHILSFAERFVINGIPVTEAEWCTVWRDIQPLCDKYELTFFEIATIMAFVLFKQRGCHWVVLETGLGGRLDATNICTPVACGITAISVEHTEFLGDTITAIAGEKAGIIKRGIPVVVNGSNPPEVRAVIQERSEIQQAPYFFSDSTVLKPGSSDTMGQWVQYNGAPLLIPLLGEFQRENAAVALKICELLNISDEVIRRGLAQTRVPCRVDLRNVSGRELIFDVAHNPQAMRTLVQALPNEGSYHFIMGVMRDKDVAGMFSALKSRALSVALFTPDIPRAFPAEELSVLVKEQLPNTKVTVHDSVTAAVESPFSGVSVVTGSFYTVCEVFQEMGLLVYEAAQ